VGIWLVLSFSWGSVLESGEDFVDVVEHQQVDFLSVVVPLDGKVTIFFAVPVAQAFVELSHCVK
jgi:hypothetical protein